ncbi:MAG: 2,3-diphosphoglycerate-dependent phosphoglycerate mutase [Methylicorpusculum sp.]|uniref:2,3-diphosphoglycerate-dependent phosphoglycerate mutase n=1 Tax=Methylicorpusculum sp. TaxID=2713644 RepID=UPI00271F6D9C|nr:2,3-diphosphoglycerate-dependent phosphoglycerate mutase [Methylicorpusculum sp.]MDO8940805.1 2,3-diphosphoglycerate-dependent phosphoglycerate mutase [Methylicorpusculum sp.]MDP2204432.1 2,3-diphosphoglycerate-dependent phosphoglycerate mutase [Methylicorpusculum sp.]
MFKLILIRHGQSVWNLENRFTGWTDVDLSDQGRAEARAAGKLLCELGYEFDLAFTSVLKRAIRTLNRIQEEMDLDWIPVIRAWQLNERHYGALQGHNKAEMADKFGESQIKIWRRSYNVLPPALELIDERHPKFDRRYANLTPEQLPAAESLKITLERVLPYWHSVLEPTIKSGKRILISAHGNSIRSLIKYLDNISDMEITELNIPTGVPLVYELDENLKVIKHYYLGDSEEITQAAAAAANQGNTKTY